MKDIKRISIAYWYVHLRWGAWSKTRKTRFSIKVDFWLSFSKPSKYFIVKTSSNNYWAWEKIPFSFYSSKNEEILNGKLHFLCGVSYTYTPSSSTVDLVLHLQYYQKSELMILKPWLKSKFVLWQPHYYKLLTEKRMRKCTFFEVLIFFWKRTATVNRKKLSSNTIFRLKNFGKFYTVKVNYFSERPNKVKERCWHIFDWPPCCWYWK